MYTDTFRQIESLDAFVAGVGDGEGDIGSRLPLDAAEMEDPRFKAYLQTSLIDPAALQNYRAQVPPLPPPSPGRNPTPHRHTGNSIPPWGLQSCGFGAQIDHTGQISGRIGLVHL